MSGDAPTTGLYSIGQFSKLTGFSIKTLRHYDEEDVLKPAVVDEASGYRYYTETQRRHMHLLAELHFAGFPVEQMRAFMRDPTLEHQGALFDWKIGQLEADIQNLTMQLRSLRRKRAHPWRGQTYEVTVEERPSKPFVFLHSYTWMQSIEEDRQHAFETLRTYLSGHGMEPSSPPTAFFVPTQDLRKLHKSIEMYAGFEVGGEVPAEGEVRAGWTPAGRWYAVRHAGPYEHIWHVKPMLRERAERDGASVKVVNLVHGEFIAQEVYHVGPWDTPDPGRWETEERWLVRQDSTGSVGAGR
ncbi:MerR family transcriptional regulator [Deinococcus apachensis]|uniref:MerR family transcriptional regulator n=1 Tax=Deinococcus apachensis TaxID=309886 RepID=UPI0003621C33|nr:MerR family transcriptional regulator [Deinococcus apachensis]